MTLFILYLKISTNFSEDWMCDQYQWVLNDGTKKLPKSNPVLVKYYHRMDKSGTFQRHGWWRISNPELVLVHYMGDSTGFERKPHGNSKKNTVKPYIRTLPSVINKIKINDNRCSATTYKELQVDCPSALVPVARPRSMQQVENHTKIARSNRRLGHDEIYNLYVIALNQSEIIEITIFPDLMFILGNQEILDEFNTMIGRKKKDDQLYCSYDTTFNLGDFYVTPIVFRHILFEESPVVPLFFMVHQRKYQTLHEHFRKVISEKVPNLRKKAVPFVSDREAGINNAIKNTLPECPLIMCWNHLKRDVKFWLQQKRVSSDNITVYMDDLKKLLMCPSEEDFDTMLRELSINWSEAYLQYFEKCIERDVKQFASPWYLKQFNLFDENSGITNNISESFNVVLKRLHNWKGKSVTI